MFRNLSGGIVNTPIMTIILSLAGILIVFVPPVLLLAVVSPFTIRLTMNSSQQAGSVSGNLYAFSTIGSLAGTFGTAFGTIPYLGVIQTMLIWSGILIVVSVVGMLGTRKWVVGSLCALVFFGFGVADIQVSRRVHSPYGRVLWHKDTLYQYVQVVRETDGSTALVYNEGGGVQSVQRPGDALNKNDYYDDYLLLPYLTPKPTQIAVLGSAGGTIPHLLAVYDHKAFPNLQVTGVEIDPSVIPLDYRYFGVQPSDAKLVNGDARMFIRQSHQQFNVVIVDAYINQIYIPPHLSTEQFFSEIKSHLAPGGILALNVNALSTDSPLLRAFEKTLKTVYPNVYRVKARGDFNYLLLGSRQPLATHALHALSSGNPLASIADEWPVSLHPLTSKNVADGMLLTDNRAPIEMLTDSMIFAYAKHPAS